MLELEATGIDNHGVIVSYENFFPLNCETLIF